VLSFNKILKKFWNDFVAPKVLSIDPILGGALIMGAGGLGAAAINADAASDAAASSGFQPIGVSSGTGTVGFQEVGFRDAALAPFRTMLDQGQITQDQFNTFAAGVGQDGFSAQLSPELQTQRDQLLGIGQAGLDQFQTFDPNQAASLFTNELDAIAAPQEARQRTSLENRLFKQGLTQSTSGADRFEALNSAQGFAQNQRNLQGLQFGQQQQERLFQNALGGIQGATALDNLAAQQVNQAIAASGGVTTANTNAAQFGFQAGQNNADALAGFFGGVGQGFTNMAFQQPTVTTDYNASFPNLNTSVFGPVQ